MYLHLQKIPCLENIICPNLILCFVASVSLFVQSTRTFLTDLGHEMVIHSFFLNHIL